MAENKPTKKKVIDVSHPGDSAPSETSKPVIITNRPIMKDPMMVSEKTTGDDNIHAPDPEMTVKQEVVIDKDEPSEKVDLKPTEETKVEAPAVEQKVEEPVSKEPATESDDQSASELKDPDADLKKASEEELARQEALQKLADSKQYYLPINAMEKRRTKRFIVLGVFMAVFLGLAWVNIALDAGLIQLGEIKAVTHFFST